MSDRLRRIVDELRVGPNDRVLEIGCGHGVAVAMICDILADGHVLAIDRSAKMIAAAERRNAPHVATGRARFMRADLETVDLGAARFDRILAVRVRLFHTEPDRAQALAQRWLAPGGRLLSIYDTPG